MSEGILKIKQEIEAEFVNNDQSWGHANNNKNPRVFISKQIPVIGVVHLHNCLLLTKGISREAVQEKESYSRFESKIQIAGAQILGNQGVKAKTISEIHSEAEKNLGLRPGAITIIRNGRSSGVPAGTGPAAVPVVRPGSGGGGMMPGSKKLSQLPVVDADEWVAPRGDSFGHAQ
ncbi:eukaryotic translation initiation factor-like [Quillaja saponaria]|uniref:Eukaryotic translation initiation factor-like n=1 Tax=Quillaja saponaria TaxID=32244 RepID=A0AAD7PSF9_QUISA|nr:eukaryotic translation initiation factor-like [Quillaja saponaria]KAJ7966283.1 eukaryotic translation initiation factor-like [Quillaja saponaria]